VSEEKEKPVSEKVNDFVDSEVRYWKGRMKTERDKSLFFDDSKYRGAINALRRLKGKLNKEVF